MTVQKNLAFIAGEGTGLDQSLLSRFEAGYFATVGLGRTGLETPTGDFHKLDLADPVAVPANISKLIAKDGPPKTVAHNTAGLVIAPFSDTTLNDYQKTLTSMVQTAILLAQSKVQPMARAAVGAFIVSSAAAFLRGAVKFATFASAKSTLRGSTQSPAWEFQPYASHICHMILDGIFVKERSGDIPGPDPAKMMKPEDMAEACWQTVPQPKSAWTKELDLRRASKGF